ncbi:MAG: diguanylate cyclase [Cellvibrionaceae bacterium]
MNDKKLKSLLDNSQQQLELILNHASEGIYGIDMDGNTTFVNNAAAQMVGLTMADMTNISNHEVVHHHYPDGRPYPIDSCPIYATVRDGHSRRGDDEYFWRTDGSCFPIEYFVSPIINNGKQEGAVITFIDITERKALESELECYRDNLEALVREKTQDLENANKQLLQLSRLDGLTGIPNRRTFDEIVDQEIRRANRNNQACGLAMIDVDYFKSYNDHYGHIEGDHSLKKVAQLLKSLFPRAGDLVARYGGEEFVLILPQSDLVLLKTQANRILKGIRDLKIPHAESGCSSTLSVSIGIALGEPPILNIEALIEKADQALYQAKHNGRDRFSIADQ